MIATGHLTVAGSAVVFAATDVDDLAVLTVLFLSARAIDRPRPWHIWAGQYLGVGTLVAVSLLAAAGLHVVPEKWVGLLGLLPLALGPADLAVTVAVFAAGVAVWCLLGSWLGSHRWVTRLVEGAEHWVVPVVFVALGALIIARSALA